MCAIALEALFKARRSPAFDRLAASLDAVLNYSACVIFARTPACCAQEQQSKNWEERMSDSSRAHATCEPVAALGIIGFRLHRTRVRHVSCARQIAMVQM